MNALPRPIWAFTALAALLSSGCNKNPQAVVPVVPAQPVVTETRAPVYPSPEEISIPQNDVSLPAPQPVPDEALPTQAGPLRLPPPPAAPEPAAPRTPKPARVTQAPSPPPTGAGDTEPTLQRSPQIGSILSPAERRRYVGEIDAALGSTKRDLGALGRRSLNASQSSSVRRIEALVAQAEEVRERDLPLAKNLAERALLFMGELKRTLQ